jgi:uncharacterized protein YjdB
LAAALVSFSVLAVVGCGDSSPSTIAHGSSTPAGEGRANTVRVNPTSLALEEGVKGALSCVAEDPRGLVLTTTPTWSSTDPNVAVVNATGNVVGQRAGTAVVSCTVDGRTASANITVAESPVAFVEVSPGAGVLEVGKTIQLAGTPRTATGGVVSGREVKWSTTDSVTATVSPTGAVVGLVEGTATVIAMSAGKASLAKINVSGRSAVPVSSVALKLDATSLSVGKQTRAIATTKDSTGGTLNNRAITWSVSDPSIASVVSVNGDRATVTALAKGTTQVTATSEGHSATETITVTPAVVADPTVQTVTVSLSWPSILPLGTSQATAVVKDANGVVLTDRVVTWSSLDGSIAVVSQTGLVTAVATGAVVIRATVEGKTGDASLTVGVASAASVTVNLAATSVLPGQTTQATAIPRDAAGNVLTGKSVSWSTLNPSIATVSIAGVVTSVTAGTATIRATVESQTGEKALTVNAAPAAPAPVAAVTASLGTYALTVGQTTQATAVTLDAGGVPLTDRTVTWSSLNPAIATVSTSGLVTAVAAGSVAIRATSETKTGDTQALTVSAAVAPPPPAPVLPGDAELPRVFLSTSVASTPSAGRTLRVAAGSDLQGVLDGALPGDRILLAAGAVFSGNFILREKTGGISGGWITVQSDGTLPPENSRVSPNQAAAFPKLISPNILPVIATSGAAARWRFMGVEVTTAPSVTTNQGLVALGCPNACETTLASQPYDIIFDRTYVHGTSTLDVRRCFGFNGARLAVIESYVSECHSGFDAQAVAGWNGPGPFKITNNYLEGAAENIAFGGGDPVVYGANLVPSDIEIRGNHITKPLSWNGKWLTKNLIELKQGRRVLIEGNVMENSWPAGQAGYAFVLWSVNQQMTCTWCVTEHVNVQNNVIRNVAGGFNLAATGSNGLAAYAAVPMNHLTIRNNVVIGLDNPAVGGNGRIFQISDAIQYLVIEHNTAFSPSNSSFLWGGNLPLSNHIVRNNLVGGGQYQIFSVWGQGQIAWDHASGGSTSSTFAGNVVAMFSGGTMIPGNYGTASFDWLGLVGGSAAAYSVSASVTDLGLLPSSGYAKKGTDGKDPGADVAAVAAATGGVTSASATAVANAVALGRLRMSAGRP